MTARPEWMAPGLTPAAPGHGASRAGGTMADLAYAPHQRHAEHDARIPPVIFRPQPLPAAVPAVRAPDRLSGREWARFLRRVLRGTDALLVAACVFAGFLVRFEGGQPLTGSLADLNAAVIGAVLGILWVAALGLYRTRDTKILGAGTSEYKRVAAASGAVFGLLAVGLVAFRVQPASAFHLVSLPLGLVLLPGGRWTARRWYNSRQALGQFLVRAIVIGEPEDVRYVLKRISKKSGAVYEILGVALPGGRRGTTFDVDGRRVPVLSSTDDVVRTVGRCGAEAVIVAGPVPGGNQYIRELGWGLEEHKAELVLASSLTNVAGPRIHWRPVEGLPLMHVDVPRYSGAKHAFKRLLDIVVASAALALLAPLFLVLAIIVKHDSPGPVLFRQERVGKAGKPFRMLKIRSMVTDADAALAVLSGQNDGAGVLFKMHNDPRVTRCGRWMRRYSLDELPQFWNVLSGAMSLVGPRPPLQREVVGYERHTHRRLLIKPGITGLWQVNGRSDLPWDEAVRLDLYYVENWSIMGDVIIIWRTFRAMCVPAGAY
ncbi:MULTISPECIES: sugar transferase [Micrococcaceae]|uniref:sugar transferase n=2 Tax=Micrococcales TaxID=85006 RepID=UPI001CFF86F2|nr:MULTISPECIES: sugar transferase [Micrococcaceae]MCB5283055.1 UDP-glucose:undecaprenyl-phosphate glucose-1-phosphate transferase [Arthrobacter sp. ES1]MDJ0352579.1 sugar transferase [Pseudarthrobacter sp. PH31-O2]WGZ79328.1 sugar transferase [Arthrobacter sp. EM1]